MKRKLFTLVCFLTILFMQFVFVGQAEAKKWTVTQRVEKLSAEIDEGRKANELTVKQVDQLKGMISSIKEKMAKMKEKNGDKLSVPDTKKLHDDMTEISVKMLRMRLDNVYSD
ncbi:MAG: hypothetical protein K2X77_13995 [Candidatus Obscuribacterales bacterium]|nr:hypothetical protein [Candidatus Obscuribacterales bacterium]